MTIEMSKQALIAAFGFDQKEQQLLAESLNSLDPASQEHTASFIKTALDQNPPSESGLFTTDFPSTLYFLVQEHVQALSDPSTSKNDRQKARQEIVKRFDNRLLFGEQFGQLSKDERRRIINSGLRVVGPRLLAQYPSGVKLSDYWEKEWITPAPTCRGVLKKAATEPLSNTGKSPEAKTPSLNEPREAQNTSSPQPAVWPTASLALNRAICVALATKLQHCRWIMPELRDQFHALGVCHIFALANLEPVQIENTIKEYLTETAAKSSRRKEQGLYNWELAPALTDFYTRLNTIDTAQPPATSLLVAPLTSWPKLSDRSREILAGYSVYISRILQSRLQEDVLRSKLPVNNGLRLLQLLINESARVGNQQYSESLAKKLPREERSVIYSTFRDVNIIPSGDFDWLLQ